jgi:hypothetical protein
MKRIRSISFIPLIFIFAFYQTSKCPKEGRDYKKPVKELEAEEKLLNKNKNRSAAVPEKKLTIIKLEDILKGYTAVADKNSHTEGKYVEINDGYVISQEEQGPETCNCGQGDKHSDIRSGDVHIYLGRKGTSKEEKEKCMVIEITPSYKKLHPEYDIKSLVGKKVTVRGYLLYDWEHWPNSMNYCRMCGSGVWRKTCWEIHPVTYISEGKESP